MASKNQADNGQGTSETSGVETKKVPTAQQKLIALQAEHDNLKNEHAGLKKENASLKNKLSSQNKIIGELQTEFDKKQEKGSKHPTGTVDGVTYELRVKSFVNPLGGGVINSSEAINDQAVMKKLVSIKSGLLRKV